MQRTAFLGCALVIIVGAGCAGDAEQPEDSAAADGQHTLETSTKSADSHTSLPRRAPEQLPVPLQLSPEDWTQYRGQARDGISRSTGLRRSWSDQGPPVLWEIAVGQGYAAPAVVAGYVFLNDYDEETNEWMVRCLHSETGADEWQYRVKKTIRPNHSITRTTPATDGGYVVAIDPKCEVHCLDARDGSVIWKKFLPEVYGTTIPPWYNGQCPLLDGDRVILAIGGTDVLMAAFEKSTGDPVWETPNSGSFAYSHSSIMPVVIDGVKQYAYNMLDGVVSIDAESGELLWHFPWVFNQTVPTTPLPLGDGKFLLTGPYGAQTVAIQAHRDGDTWSVEKVFELDPPTKGWNSEVQTPIVYRDHIYGVGSTRRGMWTCLDMQGNEVWTSQGHSAFGLGGYTLADDMFFVLEGKTGTVRVLDATADEYAELCSFQVLQGPDVWAPPVIAQGKLLIRDLGKLVCLNLAADSFGTSTTRSQPQSHASQAVAAEH